MSESLTAHYESKRNMALKRLHSAVICARGCVADSNQIGRLETWCSRLESLLETFNEAHLQLLTELRKTGKEEKEIFQSQSNYQEQADDMYSEVVEAKRKFLTNKSEPHPSSDSKQTKVAKLPPIKLPLFNGEFKDFPGFIDLFNTLVHNRSDLSNVEKFQYLITSLSGEPINIIRAFPVCEANYLSAYNSLVNRYNNKRYLEFMCWEQINGLSSMRSGSAQNLRLMLDVYSENLAMLGSLGLPTSHWDFVLFHSLLTKLDKASREAFELEMGKEFPSFKELTSFMGERCNALERSTVSNQQSSSVTMSNQTNKRVNNNQSKNTMLLAQEPEHRCVVCKEKHPLYACQSFLAKTPFERAQVVKLNKFCLNCLRPNHITINCNSTHRCKTCGSAHNTLLHFTKRTDNSNSSVKSQPKELQPKNTSTGQEVTPVTSLSNSSFGVSKNHFVLLATAIAEVRDRSGHFQKVRIVIDPGSQVHMINQACIRRLGLRQIKAITHMSGIGEDYSKSKVFIEIKPVGKASPCFSVEAVTRLKVCNDMPTHGVAREDFAYITNVELADPSFDISRSIDILLGGELFPDILLSNKIRGGPNVATAIETVFGYILMGRTSTSSTTTHASVNHASLDATLDVAIQKFWELDNVPSENTKQSHSAEEQQCEDIFIASHKRDNNGRYVVKLPFRDGTMPSFEGAYEIAHRRFNHLEKRLIAKPEVHQQYNEHIMEYLKTGQMTEVPKDQHHSSTAFYLAHHAVTTRGLRVVFDASMKDKRGVSLNDTLLTGPNLQADITNILLRFRLHAVAFCADVRQMYQQIGIASEHLNYQRILYRSSPTETIQEYQLNRVTFGVSSAPYLAIRVLHQLAHDEGSAFPVAAQVLLEDIYVDDAVTGGQSVTQAIDLQQQLINIMAAGGFELRKWSSNHPAVLENIPQEHRAVPNINQTFDNEGQFVKILGLAWNSQEDIFNYQVNQIKQECTKRTMLSELARIYDPIGLLTPLTFLAKHLIQRLWLLGSSWDQPVPDDIHEVWSNYMHQLPLLSQLRIPRRITSNDAVSYQLHGFSDASEAGYAGAVYLRSTNQHYQHQTILVSARSRVSPTKRRTLPRLELCGALLLAETMQYVINLYSKHLSIESIHAWTDSMIVLSWIKSNSTKFQAFIGNRISSIQRKLPEAVWHHVPGKQNPADAASRGLTPDELIKHELWWTGPQWLSSDQDQWPQEPQHSNMNQSDLELKGANQVCVMTVNTPEPHPFDQLLAKFSSLKKIQRIVAYITRFVDAMHKNRRSGHLSEIELNNSLMVLVKHAQYSTFKDELKLLEDNRMLPKPIRKLKPFVDSQHILRVGGRLSQSSLSYETKHPALLPRKHRLTDLIIQDTHNEHWHPGLQTMQYLLLQNFWILSPRRAINQIISRCYRCYQCKPSTYQPIMADLPRNRITQLKAFQVVGVDYAGPLKVTFQRYRGARSTKAYICVFVCFSTKAIHIELASDASTPAYLAALRRFIARRGRCAIIHSDCGTNFKGAQSDLAELMRSACEAERIVFKFNVPGSPHMGGLWEVGVKSIKTHLYRVIRDQILTYEELNTLLIPVESLLNSRPLSPLSSDPSDLSALTPGHFLTLAPLTTVPARDYTNTSMNRLTRWQLIQKMHQHFWARWHREYLTNLSQRLKWSENKSSAKLDQLVIIKDENIAPLKWRLGRIIELHPGRDGVCRTAAVRTSQGVFKRPLVKLCPLPDMDN